MVLASMLIMSTLTVAQGRLLDGQDPAAITAVQFLGAAIAALPVAACTEGGRRSRSRGRWPARGPRRRRLTVAGTLGPFTLFAYGQRQVSAEVAGAFLNLEPLVGALVGVAAFGDPAGPRLLAGGAAILGGILMGGLPALRARPRLATVG